MTVNSVETVQERLLLRPKEAARALGVSERTLWGLTDLTRIRIGRSVRYSVDDLRAWIAGKKSGAAK